MSGLGIKVESLVNGCFDTVKAKIPAFVDAHLEERRFNKQLNDFLDSEEISKKVTQKRDALIRKAYQDVGNFFSDLEKEGQFTMGWMNLPERGVRIVNWKKIIKWGGIALGIVASIVTEGAWPLILLPISELLDRISERIRTKRARKAEYKAEKVASIIRHLDGQRNKMSKKLIADLDNNLTNGLLKEAGRRFYALKISIEALLNGQRHLVDRYNRCHLEVSRKIITNILDSLGYGPEDYATLQVARIPGKWTVLVPGDDRIWTRSGESNSKSLPARTISSLLGNQERVTVLWLDTSLPKTSQARFLLHYMFGRGCWFCSLNDEYGYMYVDRTLTGEQYLDRINIIEQLLNVLILPNDKYYGKD